MQSRASIISVALLISLFEVPCVNAQTVQKGEWVIKNNCSLAASSEKTLLHEETHRIFFVYVNCNYIV